MESTTATKIDLGRCRRGMAQLWVEGRPRPALIEEAIQRIQDSPESALQREYLGIKNYASFGDQRADCSYGMAPSHGHIVFRIGRATSFLGEGKVFDRDAVYYLEAYRDFGVMAWIPSANARAESIDLGHAIREHDRLASLLGQLKSALSKDITSHAVTGVGA